MIASILCPIDGSEHSDKAVTLATNIAQRYGAKLCFLHVFMRGVSLDELNRFSNHAHLKDVVEEEAKQLSAVISTGVGPYAVPYLPPPSAEVIKKIGEVLLEEAKREAEGTGVRDVTTTVVDGDTATQIVEHAKLIDADMIVMGSRGLGSFRGFLNGSVSSKVSHLTECTCVSVK